MFLLPFGHGNIPGKQQEEATRDHSEPLVITLVLPWLTKDLGPLTLCRTLLCLPTPMSHSHHMVLEMVVFVTWSLPTHHLSPVPSTCWCKA